MCDTLVALPDHTASGNLIFAKNSDREPNEAQVIVRAPAATRGEEWLQCTYIQVPQVRQTSEVILSKPFQMWGAEMGANEHGVVIGNVAVFTRIKMPHRNTGLTGMDLLRLALERTSSAGAALSCITELLERYGQNACGGYKNRKFFYHNSFIIADTTHAWVLETAGRHWVARRVREVQSISNGLTIGREYDRISEDAVAYAYRRRWLRDTEPFDFSNAYSEWFMTRMSSCNYRQGYTLDQLKKGKGDFSVKNAMEILSSHEPQEGEFKLHRASTANICMHATGLTAPSQTTGSMVAEMRTAGPSTIWLTGTSMPCLSVYLPFFFGGDSLRGQYWILPGEREDDSLWWKAERLHRLITKDYQKGRALIEGERRAFQQELLEQEARYINDGASREELDAFSHRALAEYRRYLEEWTRRVKGFGLKRRLRNPLFWLYQRRTNAKAGLD
jgi:dipeptidase